MRTTCPKCAMTYDITDADIMSAAGRIREKRRTNRSGPTSDQARAAGAKGAASRWGKRESPEADTKP